jgi:NOL1/NOP2/fmu family ribosome biogenesis protein
LNRLCSFSLNWGIYERRQLQQIAAAIKGKGIIVSNDKNPDRVKALVKNIELCGIKNAIVTKESPEVLARNFKGYFDRILVDAPCSGEGMFRKDEDAARSWGKYKCSDCALMQKSILAQADIMLKPGGRLVYSTCTFSPEEDEMVISNFLDEHKDYELHDIPKVNGTEPGRPEWGNGKYEMTRTARLWPHRMKGEGHFVALLQKADGKQGEKCISYMDKKYAHLNLEAFFDFCKENIKWEFEGYFYISGQGLYWLPQQLPDLKGVKAAKFGWYLGQITDRRFEPSHSMIAALRKEQVMNTIDMDPASDEVKRYLKGETLILDSPKGYTGVCVDGYTLGWAKQTGQMLKNLYPKGWRRLS